MTDRTWMLTIAILFTALVPYALADSGNPRRIEPVQGHTPRASVPFGLGLIAPKDNDLPAGWQPLAEADAEIEGAPTKEVLLTLATATGIDPADLEARSISMQQGEGGAVQQGVAAWIAIDGAMLDFARKITEASQSNGWKIRAVGTPQRVLVSWGSSVEAGQAIDDWQVAVAVTQLCEAAQARFAVGSSFPGTTDEERLRYAEGLIMLNAAGSTEPDAGIFHALMGRLIQWQNPANAVERYRRALRRGAPIPPPDDLVVEAAHLAGQVLLQREKRHVLDEALTMLQQGVRAEESAPLAVMRFGNRYNLACTYARLGRQDEAFLHLEEGLRFLKAASDEEAARPSGGEPGLDYAAHYKHALEIDTDMAPLRADARWAPLMAKYAPATEAPSGPGEAAEKKNAHDKDPARDPVRDPDKGK